MKRFSSLLPLAFALLVTPLVVSAQEGTKPTKGPKPIRISQGMEVKLEDYVVPGKKTVFDFTSDYCPPCRAIAPYLDRMHEKRDDIAVVKVDINRPGVKRIDWESPVAKQHGLRSVPYFKVYGPDGQVMAEGNAARSLVGEWLE